MSLDEGDNDPARFFETRPAIRFILVQSPDVSELIILCHHIICDGMSLAFLARDLMMQLGDPTCEVKVLPAPPAIDLNNLPGDVSQSGIVKFFINRMNKKWAEQSPWQWEMKTRSKRAPRDEEQRRWL